MLQGQQAQYGACLTNICAGVLLQLGHPILRFGERLAARDVIHHCRGPRSPAILFILSTADLQTLMQAEVISFCILTVLPCGPACLQDRTNRVKHQLQGLTRGMLPAAALTAPIQRPCSSNSSPLSDRAAVMYAQRVGAVHRQALRACSKAVPGCGTAPAPPCPRSQISRWHPCPALWSAT